jgi:hypothetical protein
MIDNRLFEDLTPQERERLVKLARQPLEGERYRQAWEPGRPSPPHLLEGRRCPLSGRPLSRDERLPGEPEPLTAALELPSQRAWREREEWEAFKEFAAMTAQQKTQLVACLRWGKEPHPAWLCQLVATAAQAADPGCFPVVLKAPSELEAKFRYQTLMGITSYDSNNLEIRATKYAPAEGAA